MSENNIKKDRYLSFVLCEEEYAVSIGKVKEIINMVHITKVPRAPEYIKGVINLRGKVIRAVDLRLKLGIEEREYDDLTSIIIVEQETESGTKVSGVIVDDVKEVLDILQEDIDEVPEYGTAVDENMLLGMGKVKDNIVMIIDIDKVLSAKEEEALN